MTNEERGVVTPGNQADQWGNVVADCALIKLGMGTYTDEFTYIRIQSGRGFPL